MKKLSKQTYKYLCFEVARLRTRWDHDEENRSAIEKRYREVIKEFNSRTNNWFWTKHPIDKIVKGQAIQEKMIKAKHSFTECMDCKKAPEVEVLWAEGRAHAWFCNKCYGEWKRKKFELNGKMLTYESEVVKERKIDGEASKKWSKPVKKAKVEFEGHKGKWVTLNGGQKLFIREGETIDNAIGRLESGPKVTIVKDGYHVKFKMEDKGNADIFLDSDAGGKKEKGSAYLNIVDIKEKYRGKGYGKKLVNRVESYAEDKGIKRIYIRSTHDSVKFWDKMGYKPYLKKPKDPVRIREIWNLRRRKEIA